MTKKIKETSTAVSDNTKTVVRNLSLLVESASLLVVAGYAFYTAYHAHGNKVELKFVIAASLVIGVRGAYEFLRYLANKEVK